VSLNAPQGTASGATFGVAIPRILRSRARFSAHAPHCHGPFVHEQADRRGMVLFSTADENRGLVPCLCAVPPGSIREESRPPPRPSPREHAPMPTASATVRLIASNAVKEACAELVPAFAKVTGHEVVAIWGGTLDISARIGAGE